MAASQPLISPDFGPGWSTGHLHGDSGSWFAVKQTISMGEACDVDRGRAEALDSGPAVQLIGLQAVDTGSDSWIAQRNASASGSGQEIGVEYTIPKCQIGKLF